MTDNTTPKRLELTSADGTQLNLDALYQIAPSCFTEERDATTGEVHRKVNFEILRELLGDAVANSCDESYQFTWPGKQEARKEAAAAISDTLRPVPEDSLEWETTQNIYIEGDNLRVLKLLQRGYMGKVKMIYIDPPYNTGNDFVYHDNYSRSQTEESFEAGDIDEEGNRYRKNSDSNGRFHSDWCSMIYSRLLVARSLLAEDGVIFISIDDNEVHNLRKICDEVFGSKNCVLPFIWQLPRGINAGLIARAHEYILCITKNQNAVKQFNRLSTEEESSIERCNRKINARHPESVIEVKAGIRYEGKDQVLQGVIEGAERITILDPLIFKDGRLVSNARIAAGWTMKNMFNDWQNGKTVYDSKGQPIVEFFFKENGRLYSKKELRAFSIKSVLKDVPDSQIARTQIEELLGSQDIFSYPKPIELVKLLAQLVTTPDSLILDFFSGSATTAHAVMQLNAEDGGRRKYILVQLPEQTPIESEARRAGYNTISEIAKERIRRAGAKIKEAAGEKAKDLDVGFRVFRLDSSNYGEVFLLPRTYRQEDLERLLYNIKADRTDLDLLFGAMLSWGVQLSLPMTTERVGYSTVYTVNEGELVACFDQHVTEEVILFMASKKPARVLFRDHCFTEDKVKINLFELFKQHLGWSNAQALANIRVI